MLAPNPNSHPTQTVQIYKYKYNYANTNTRIQIQKHVCLSRESCACAKLSSQPKQTVQIFIKVWICHLSIWSENVTQKNILTQKKYLPLFFCADVVIGDLPDIRGGAKIAYVAIRSLHKFM